MAKFTELYIKNLKPEAARYEKTDGGCPGLVLRVTPAGSKSWSFMYRRGGKLQRVGIGPYPRVSLKAARTAAGRERDKLEADQDPAEEARKRRKGPTFGELAQDFIEKAATGRWGDEAQRYLERDAIPAWKNKKAHKIGRRDVLELIEAKAKTAPVAANRLLAVIRRVFNWGMTRDLVPLNPATRMPAPGQERQRERVLSADEIRALWVNLDNADMTDTVRDALRLILATAQRPGEVLAMEREEIDGEWWTIPGTKTKNGRPQRIPLPPLAVEIIKRRPEAGPLFPSPRTDKTHVAVNALSHAVRRNLETLKIAHFRPHDLRRTAASNMAECGIPRLIISRILNHTENGVTGIYDRYGYADEKRDALQRWNATLSAMIQQPPAKVRKLRARA